MHAAEPVGTRRQAVLSGPSIHRLRVSEGEAAIGRRERSATGRVNRRIAALGIVGPRVARHPYMVLRFAPPRARLALGLLVAVIFAILPARAAGETRAGGIAAAALEVAPPPEAYGTSVAELRTIAADALEEARARQGSSGSRARRRRAVVVSISLAPPTAEPIVCSLNATVRDEVTGAVIAIIETSTRATGPLSAGQRTALAHAAVRSAARRVPSALALAK